MQSCDWLRAAWVASPAVGLDLRVQLQHLRLQRLTDGAEGSTPPFAGSKLRPGDDITAQR